MKEVKRKILSLVLCGCLVAGMFPAVALADDSQTTDTTPVVTTETTGETPTSGQCGDNLTWNYDEATKTLTISGTGDMYDYLTPEAGDPNAAPWKDLDVTTLVVEDGVTSIGWDAFKNIPSLTSVTLPNSIKTMDSAFPFTGLTSITIPEGVTSINNAFWGCSNLTSVTIPDTVTSMQAAFVACSGLTSIDIPDRVTNINGAFQECTSLTSVTVPSSVTSMLYAFADCTNLTTVNIPVSLTTIGESSFANCAKLTTVNYAGTQAQWEAIDIVESGNDILNSVTVNYTETPVTPTPTPDPTPTPTPAPETPAQDKVDVTVSGDKAEATVGGVALTLANAGKVFEAGTVITVEKVTQGQTYETVKKALETVVTKMDNTAIFEFTATKDGKAVQPGGALSVTFDIPKNLSASNLKMFYVSEDGKYEEVKITVDTKAGTVTANLTHFSTYVLANVARSANDGNGVPQTGDTSALTLYVCVLAMSMAGLTILMVNKRRA